MTCKKGEIFEMNVLTLNTHSWMEENPEGKLKQLAETILEKEYDVIALQEVNQRIDARPAIVGDLYCPVSDHRIHEDNFALRLVELLEVKDVEYYWTWTFSHIGYNQFHEGLAILSKHPILPRDFLISVCDDAASARRRVLLTGVTEIEGTMVTIANGHYSWWSEDLSEGFFPEWQATENVLKEHSYPLILMGDFNNPAGSSGYQLMTNSPLGLKDTYVSSEKQIGSYTVAKAIDGWSENKGELRIDYIFTTSELQAEVYQVMFDDRSAPVVSDHFGVSVKFN